MLPYADLAQLVEHMPEEHSVLGSTPRVRTILYITAAFESKRKQVCVPAPIKVCEVETEQIKAAKFK